MKNMWAAALITSVREKMHLKVRCLAQAALAAIVLSSAPAMARNIASILPGGVGVAPQCEYSTLADAVANARSGDTIHIQSGFIAGASAVIGVIPSGVNLDFVSATSNCASPSAIGTRATLLLAGGSLAIVSSGAVFFENIAIIGGGDILTVDGGAVWLNDSVVTGASGTVARITGRLNMENTDVIGGAATAFIVEPGGELWVSSSSIDDNVGTDGGAIRSSGYVSLYNTSLNRNSATNGGAVYLAANSNAILTDSGSTEYRDNAASDDGGAIYMGATTTATFRSRFVNNSAASLGGAVYMDNAAADFVETSIATGTAFMGGAIYAFGSTLDFDDVGVSYSTGGAIRTIQSSLTADGLSVHWCWGSAVHLSQTPATFTGLSITDTQSGAGLRTGASDVTIDGPAGGLCGLTEPCNVFSGNDEGAIFAFGGGHLEVHRTWFESNTGVIKALGAAIHVEDATSTAVVGNSVIIDSNAPAIMIDEANVDLTQLTIADNNGRPVSYRKGATGSITNSILRGNNLQGWVGGGAAITVSCTNHQGFNLGSGSFVGLLNTQQAAAQFLDRANNDYRLAATSPSVDVCASGARPDLIGWGLAGAAYDQGAYERQ